MFVLTLPPSAAQDPLSYAKKAQEAGADILEIRGDLTPNITIRARTPAPTQILVSPRGTGPGLIEALHPQYIDLEIGEDLPILRYSDTPILIRSYHNYDSTPSLKELKEIIDQILVLSPVILKIATQINSFADLAILEQLHDLLPEDQQRIILGMGPHAHLNRLQSPMKNVMTYTCLTEEDAAAPGQIPIALYKTIYKNKQNNSPSTKAECNEAVRRRPGGDQQTEHTHFLSAERRRLGRGHKTKEGLYGLLGGPEVSSKSPLLHNALFAKYDIDALYTAFLTNDLDDAWRYILEKDVRGLSVTSPFKQEVITKLDALDPVAKKIGSVNTVIWKDKKSTGYNTDTIGLQKGYDFWNDVRSVAILGSGGVTPAIIHACRAKGIEDIRMYAIDATSRESLAEKWNIIASPLEEITNAHPDLIINAISADVDLPLPQMKIERLIIENCHVLDLKYASPSKFLTTAQQRGYTVHNGFMMLLHQALAQFELFTDVAPSREDITMLKRLLE